LSRPRRFGKTLLLDTIEELFSGNRDLFRDLWIGRSDYDFPKHPVISLSMSVDSENSDLLKANLLNDLKDIADNAGLTIAAPTPDTYFGKLIKALYDMTKAGVVVLIDEYDAPVTNNMHNPEVAKSNVNALHVFFSSLKKPGVRNSLRFTLVTGITRYALTSMDSGLNHLTDISLDSRYGGICGFTLDEFGPLFADLMELNFNDFKKLNNMDPSAGRELLWDKIKHWYDGYNWGGQTRVLNPFSILNFFDQRVFDSYWIQSGRPAHLTALIQANPSAFTEPELTLKSSKEIRKSELTRLEIIPVLFHGGYLTVDKITPVPTVDPLTKEMESVNYYSFRLPNFEVSYSYHQDVWEAIIDKMDDRLITKGKEIQNALLVEDALAIETIFSNFFAAIPYHLRPKAESTFNAYINLILSSAGFTVRSQLPGASVRLDCLVELADRVYVIIETKFCQNPSKKINQAERNAVLALLAKNNLSELTLSSELAKSKLREVYNNEIKSVLSQNSNISLVGYDKLQLIVDTIQSSAPVTAVNEVLAKLAEENFSPDKIEAALADESASRRKPTPERINELLTEGANKALNSITEKGYRKIVENEANRIIDLGLAIFDHGATI
jgi:hypothetical protein